MGHELDGSDGQLSPKEGCDMKGYAGGKGYQHAKPVQQKSAGQEKWPAKTEIIIYLAYGAQYSSFITACRGKPFVLTQIGLFS
jgi:hypothetical protein